jgi:hypothetical protein
MKKERITEIATHHQRAMSSVHPHAIIGTIEDAIEQALTEAKIFLQPDVSGNSVLPKKIKKKNRVAVCDHTDETGYKARTICLKCGVRVGIL